LRSFLTLLMLSTTRPVISWLPPLNVICFANAPSSLWTSLC